MTWIEDARAEVELAAWARQQMTQEQREHYAEHLNPGGMFVGELTGWLVVPDETVAAMLDALEAAEGLSDEVNQEPVERETYEAMCALDAKIARVRERFEGRP